MNILLGGNIQGNSHLYFFLLIICPCSSERFHPSFVDTIWPLLVFASFLFYFVYGYYAFLFNAHFIIFLPLLLCFSPYFII